MSDCANIEMRELLPEYLHERLGDVERARVAAHLASCEDCAAELEAMRAARSALSRTLPIDTRKIVAALPRPVQRTSRPALHFPVWRVAAALTMVSVGGLSLVLARKAYTPEPMTPPSVVSTTGIPDVPPAPSPSIGSASEAPAPAVSRPALSFGGGLDDLENTDIEALIAAVDGLDVALAIDPEPASPLAQPGDTTQ